MYFQSRQLNLQLLCSGQFNLSEKKSDFINFLILVQYECEKNTFKFRVNYISKDKVDNLLNLPRHLVSLPILTLPPTKQLINYERLSITVGACTACSNGFSGQVPPRLCCIPVNEARKLNACQTVDGQVVSCRQVGVQLSFVSDAPLNSYACDMVRTNFNDREKM